MMELAGMTSKELEQLAVSCGQPAFRGKQLFRWLHQGADFDDMTNLPKAFRERLKAEAVAQTVTILHTRRSKISDTVKFL